MQDNRILVLISATNPSNELIDYIRELSLNDIDAIVVNDGSEFSYEELFNKIADEGHVVLKQAKKMGSGRSLKTAINYMLNLENLPPYTGVVVTTADKINTIDSVLRLEKEMAIHPELILLVRQNVNYDNVSTQGKIFNRFTSFITRWIYGKRILDNFTKLRAYPIGLIEQILETKGEDEDLEARFLAEAMNEGVAVREIRIDNNYHAEDNNAKQILGKFRVVRELVRPFAKYTFVSLLTSLVELSLFRIFITLFKFFGLETGWGLIFTSVLLAKGVSSLVNIILNRNYKYIGSGRKKSTFYKHLFVNFVKVTLSSYLIYNLMNRFNSDEVSTKIFVDIVLFFVFYKVIYYWVFSKNNKKK